MPQRTRSSPLLRPPVGRPLAGTGERSTILFIVFAVLLLLSSQRAAAQCDVSYDPDCVPFGSGEAPEVSISPDVGDYVIVGGGSQTVSVKIVFSDRDGLRQETRKITLLSGGVTTVLSGFSWVPRDGTYAHSEGTIELRSGGEHILRAEIADAAGNVGRNEATFSVTIRDVNVPVVSLAPHHDAHRLTTLGAAELSYSLPAYVSMDAARSTGLYYSSQHADPTGFVQLDVDTGTAAEGSQVAAVTLQILEQDWSQPGGVGVGVTSEDAWAKHPSGKQRLGAQWSMRNKPTGAYRYWGIVRAYREDKTLIGTTRVEFRVLVKNEVNSRYGSGWSLAGVQRIHPRGDGKIDGLVVDEGNGIVRFFEMGSCSGNQCSYRSPDGDFSQIVYTAWSDLWGQYTRTYPDGSKIGFAGKAAGTMGQVVDRLGRVTTYQWQNTWETVNPVPVVANITDPAGKVTTFAYHSGIYLKEIVDPAGRTASFSFTNGDLTQITGPASLAVSYDSAHRSVAYTDWTGTWSIGYDVHGTVSELTTPAVVADGQSVRLKTTYQSLHATTVLASWVTHICCNWAAAVPANAVLTTATDPLGHTTRYAFDRYGNLTHVSDPLDRTGHRAYNKDGLLENINHGTQHIQYAWSSGRLVSQTVNGAVAYSASYNGNLLEYEMSGGVERWYSYGDRGQLLKSWTGKKEDSYRTATTYEYDANYRTVAANGPSGERTEWSYDNPWKNVSATRRIREDGVTHTTSFTYDGAGRARTTTNALGQTSTFTYDAHNRTETSVDGSGKTTQFAYSGPFLTRVTDAGGKAYGYTYNALGWLESEKFPEDTTTRTYRYDKDGQLIGRTDRRGRTVKTAYDSAHRVVSHKSGLTLSAADAVDITVQYPDAYTVIMSNKESAETIRTDPHVGGVSLVKGTIGGPLSNRYYEIGTVYDATDRAAVGIDVRQYQDSILLRTEAIRYTFDPRPADTSLAEALSITDLSGRTTTLGYDASGRHVRTMFPNGVTQYNGYRKDGVLTSRTFSALSLNQELGATYARDHFGSMTARTSATEDRRSSYGYDADGQLTEYWQEKIATELGCDPSQTTCQQTWQTIGGASYGYDAVGNRTDRGATMLANSNRYATFDGYTLQYDAEGNLVRKSKPGFDQQLAWNDLGQLSSVTTNGVTVTYGYSPQGFRIRRTEGSQTRYSVYHNDELLLELDGGANPLNAYTYMPGIDRPLSVKARGQSSSTYYYTMDAPGHVDGLLNTSGGLVSKYRYAPFGTMESASEGVSQSLKFMGREVDDGTGLYYVRARWYDPSLARFISSDPIGLAGGVNTYAYVGNDPMNRRDPSGLQFVDDVTLPPIAVCTRLWSWGWDDCNSDYIFWKWRAQRDSEDFYDFGTGIRVNKLNGHVSGPDVVPCTPATCPSPTPPAPPPPTRIRPDRTRTVQLDCSAAGYGVKAVTGAAIGGAGGAIGGWFKDGGALIVGVSLLGTVVGGPALGYATFTYLQMTPLGTSAARGAVAGGVTGVATGAAGGMATHAIYCGDAPGL